MGFYFKGRYYGEPVGGELYSRLVRGEDPDSLLSAVQPTYPSAAAAVQPQPLTTAPPSPRIASPVATRSHVIDPEGPETGGVVAGTPTTGGIEGLRNSLLTNGKIRLVDPQGGVITADNIDDIDMMINAGFRVLRKDGSFANHEGFGDGSLIDGVPINTILTGTMTEQQRQMLLSSGRQIPNGVQTVANGPVNPAGGQVGTGTGTGNQGTPGGGLGGPPAAGTSQTSGPQIPPGDVDTLLRFLIQQAVTGGARGQENLERLLSEIHNVNSMTETGAIKRMAQQEELVNALMAMSGPTLEEILGQVGEGLSPEANAALRQQATEGSELAYQNQVGALKSDLARRGALSSDRPGALDELVRGYGPLMSARDTTRANMMSNAALANEQARLQSFGLGLNALGTAGNLYGTAANIYDPNALLGANQQGMNTLLNAIQSHTGAGMQGLGLASTLASTLATPDDHSLRNSILSALIGAGMKLVPSGGTLGGGNNNSNVLGF